jgi:hypothetical protein
MKGRNAMDAKATSNEVQRRILDAVDDAFDRQIETTKQFSAIPRPAARKARVRT